MNSTPYFGAAGGMVPKRYDSAYNLGLRFFVLRWPKPIQYPKLVSGFFDIRVSDDGINSGIGTERYLTGRDAHVEFRPNENKIATAYVVDDRYYHNRMCLLDNQKRWHVDGMVSRDIGMMTSGEAQMELRCLDEVIREDVTIFRVVDPHNNGRQIDWFYTEEEAMAFIAEEKMVIKGSHGVPHPEQPHRKCIVVPGKIRAKKPEIQELIKRYAGDNHGWTACAEFKDVWIPKVARLIKERRDKLNEPSIAPQVSEEDIQKKMMNILASMSSDQISKLHQIAKTSTGDRDSTQESSAPVDTEKQYSKSALERLRIDDLRVIANARGIPTEDKTKPTLITDIVTAQEAAMEELT